MISAAPRSVKRSGIAFTGAVMMSRACLSGWTRSFRSWTNRSFTWNRVRSFTVAEAAVTCPPPPKASVICPTSTASRRLRATKWTRLSMRTRVNRTLMFSMSRSLCVSMARSPTYRSREAVLMTTRTPLIV